MGTYFNAMKLKYKRLFDLLYTIRCKTTPVRAHYNSTGFYKGNKVHLEFTRF